MQREIVEEAKIRCGLKRQQKKKKKEEEENIGLNVH
jgi:hypothetical protein